MPETPQLFDGDAAIRAFEANLQTHAIGRTLQYFPSAHSTNDVALDAARTGAAHGLTVIADVQTRGRGRRGRRWESPAGVSLLFSVLMRPEQLETADYGWIPLLAGLSAAEGIRELCGLNVTLKWPNDIVLPSPAEPGWRKAGGILCESIWAADPSGPRAACIVIGIGLNVNQQPEQLPAHAMAPPSSLRIEHGAVLSRQYLLCAVLRRLEANWEALAAEPARSELLREIQARLSAWWTPECVLHVHRRTAQGKLEQIAGQYAGLDRFGRLKLRIGGQETALADAEIARISLG